MHRTFHTEFCSVVLVAKRRDMSFSKNDAESLSSLRSLQSANTVAELFSDNKNSLKVTDTSKTPSSVSESSKTSTSTCRLDKKKGLLRGCPHCLKHFPDYSALSSHVNVRLLQQHFLMCIGCPYDGDVTVEMIRTKEN